MINKIINELRLKKWHNYNVDSNFSDEYLLYEFENNMIKGFKINILVNKIKKTPEKIELIVNYFENDEKIYLDELFYLASYEKLAKKIDIIIKVFFKIKEDILNPLSEKYNLEMLVQKEINDNKIFNTKELENYLKED